MHLYKFSKNRIFNNLFYIYSKIKKNLRFTIIKKQIDKIFYNLDFLLISYKTIEIIIIFLKKYNFIKNLKSFR